MRQLLPDHRVLQPEDLYAGWTLPTASDRTFVAVGMVSSLDGASTIDGVSGGLGGDGDRLAFRRLRDAADAILVGASTARDERYRPVRPDTHRQEDRIRRGLRASPQLVVVSGSLELDPELPMFRSDEDQPVVVTGRGASAPAMHRLQNHAEVVQFDSDEVDAAELMRECYSRGWRRVLCEGGPNLNGQLLAHDLIDEVYLTVAPIAVAGASHRIFKGSGHEALREFQLATVHEHDGELLLHYRRAR